MYFPLLSLEAELNYKVDEPDQVNRKPRNVLLVANDDCVRFLLNF